MPPTTATMTRVPRTPRVRNRPTNSAGAAPPPGMRPPPAPRSSKLSERLRPSVSIADPGYVTATAVDASPGASIVGSARRPQEAEDLGLGVGVPSDEQVTSGLVPDE